MSVATGNDGVVLVGGQIITRLFAWSLNRSSNRVDVTSMGETERSNLAGFLDGQGSFSVHWDPADSFGQQALIPVMLAKTTVSVVLYPMGNSSGRPRITIASGVILGVNDGGSLDNALDREFQFGKSGGSIVEDVIP